MQTKIDSFLLYLFNTKYNNMDLCEYYLQLFCLGQKILIRHALYAEDIIIHLHQAFIWNYI